MVNGTTELSDQPHRVVQVIYCQPPTIQVGLDLTTAQ